MELTSQILATKPQKTDYFICHVWTNDLAPDLTRHILSNKMIDIITAAKTTFPSATVAFTGFIPRKGVSLKSVLDINDDIYSLCSNHNVSFLFNKDDFLATNSFPRHLFKADKVHLNEKSMGVLARAIKYFMPRQERGLMHSSLQSLMSLRDYEGTITNDHQLPKTRV